MNQEAQRHLDKAGNYLAKGESWYRKAADEIVAAQKADFTLSYQEIAERFGRSDRWAKDIVLWVTSGKVLPSPWTEANAKKPVYATKKMLREAPVEEIVQIVAALPPERRANLRSALDVESLERQKERERVADEKFREHVGDDLADDLKEREELQSTEYLLIKSRQNLRGFVKRVGDRGAENTPESWRHSCLDWLDDLKGHIGMAEALLAGNDIDWTEFDELLAKEGN